MRTRAAKADDEVGLSARGPPTKISDSGKAGVAPAFRHRLGRGRRAARGRGVNLDQLLVDVVGELLVRGEWGRLRAPGNAVERENDSTRAI